MPQQKRTSSNKKTTTRSKQSKSTASRKKVTQGTGGLLSFGGLNKSRVLLVALAVALVGGFLVYRSYAAGALLALPGIDEGQAECTAAGGTVTKETTGSKRNSSVCKLAAGMTYRPVVFGNKTSKSVNEAQFINVSKNFTDSGYFKACYNFKKVGAANATVTMGGYKPGTNTTGGTTQVVSNTDYTPDNPVCDPTPYKAGSTRVFLTVKSGTVNVASVGLREVPDPTKPTDPPVSTSGIWLNRNEIMALPTSGAAWESVRSAAYGNWGTIDLSNNNSTHDTSTLAGALVAVRLNDATLRQKTRDAIMSATTTTKYARALEASRNLTSYVIAADVIGLSGADNTAFRSYIDQVRFKALDGHSGGNNIHETALVSANNWGGMARAASTAISLYLGDTARVNELVVAQRAFLGENVSDQLSYTGTNWHASSDKAGINRRGATIQSRNVDGVIPEDQRRTGDFSWPAPKGSYPWEALQGTIVTSAMLHRAGKLNFRAGDDAIVRSFNWLYSVNSNPAGSDDLWQPWLVNKLAGSNFSATSPAGVGKNMGWTDWTHR